MTDIDAELDAIDEHGKEVLALSDKIVDAAAAGARSVPDLNFGLLPGPVIYPVIGPLWLAVEGAVSGLAATGAAIGAGLEGTAAAMRAAETVTVELIKIAGKLK